MEGSRQKHSQRGNADATSPHKGRQTRINMQPHAARSMQLLRLANHQARVLRLILMFPSEHDVFAQAMNQGQLLAMPKYRRSRILESIGKENTNSHEELCSSATFYPMSGMEKPLGHDGR